MGKNAVSQWSVIDLTVLGVYLIGVTLIGCLMARRTKTSQEFMSAGGSLPGWVVGLSIIGTFVSSISFIANPESTFSGNWNGFVFSLTLPYAAWVATRFFVSWFRESGSLSAYEPLEKRFGLWARIYAALFNVLYHIARVGMILYGVSLAVSTVAPVPLKTMIVLLGVLVTVYTLLGGIEAVIWTDVVQSIILIGGMLLCAGLLLMRIPGGASTVLEHAHNAADNRLSLGATSLNLHTFSIKSVWMMLLFGFVANLQNFAADQTFIQRYFTASSVSSARRSVWMGAIAYLPVSAVLFFIGTALFVYYDSVQQLPESVSNTAKILPYFIMHEMPAGLTGLLIAAILAAAMSTVDSSLNSSATLLLCDGFRQVFPHTQDRTELRFLRWTTVILGALGIAAAICMIRIEAMLEAWWQISGILSGGTLALILLARFSRVSGRLVSIVATLAGVVTIAAVTIAGMKTTSQSPGVLISLQSFLSPVREYIIPQLAGTVGTVVIVVVALCLSPFLSTGPTGGPQQIR